VLCWIWLGAIVLFFSIPRSKLIGYILPVLPPLALLAALGWQRALAARPRAGRWFAAAWLLAAALPVAITLAAPRIEGGKLSRDVAAELACRAAPGDPIYALGGYPMDLPFTAQTQQPLRLVQDWARTRAEAGDTWARELFEAGDFEPATARRILLQPEVLAQAARQPHAWLLAPRDCRPTSARCWPAGSRCPKARPGRCTAPPPQRRKAQKRPSTKVCPAATPMAANSASHEGQPAPRSSRLNTASFTAKPATAVTASAAGSAHAGAGAAKAQPAVAHEADAEGDDKPSALASSGHRVDLARPNTAAWPPRPRPRRQTRTPCAPGSRLRAPGNPRPPRRPPGTAGAA
jgi:hypothetical protein